MGMMLSRSGTVGSESARAGMMNGLRARAKAARMLDFMVVGVNRCAVWA